MLFLGTYDYSMDERGRIPVPPSFREALMAGIVLTRGTPQRCLRAYAEAKFQEKAELFLAQPETTQAGRDMRLAVFSTAQRVEMDAQSRILVPPLLRQWAGLERHVFVVGTGDSFTVWSAGEYEQAAGAAQARYLETLGSE
jgi:MraZ protein